MFHDSGILKRIFEVTRCWKHQIACGLMFVVAVVVENTCNQFQCTAIILIIRAFINAFAFKMTKIRK